MKQADSTLHCSGRRGGDNLVLDKPAAGVLQKIATATDATGESPFLASRASRSIRSVPARVTVLTEIFSSFAARREVERSTFMRGRGLALYQQSGRRYPPAQPRI